MQNQTSEGGGLREELQQDTGRVAAAATDRIQSEADSRKGEMAGQARAVSSALGSAARELGTEAPSWVKSALEQGARSIDQLAQAVEGKDSRQLMGDVQNFARQRPGSFLAGCALLGFAASRVFKADTAQASPTPSTPVTQNSPSWAATPAQDTTQTEPRPLMNFGDGGGSAYPVSPQNLGTSL